MGNSFTMPDAVAPVAGTYCDRDDLDIRFGSVNIDKWADLNNTASAAQIAARIDWACEQAFNDINDGLRGGPYVVPFEATYPMSLVDFAARWAAALLHESRALLNKTEEGESGGPELKPLKRILYQIKTGQKRWAGLDYTLASYPQIVEDDTIDDDTAVAIIISSD